MLGREDKINRKRKKFFKYLRKKILGKDYSSYLDNIAKETDVYIFSGVIRDFFMHRDERRDLDIVVIDYPQDFLDEFKSDPRFVSETYNKFGGIKLVMKDLILDIWRLRDTWGIKKKHLDVNDAHSLTHTTFFNFSSIVFDYNDVEFLYDKAFMKFLDDKTMDVVFSRNLDDACCIVSTLYYQREYNFGISERLARWLKDKYNSRMDFDAVQLRRFGEIEFSPDTIKELILNEL